MTTIALALWLGAVPAAWQEAAYPPAAQNDMAQAVGHTAIVRQRKLAQARDLKHWCVKRVSPHLVKFEACWK